MLEAFVYLNSFVEFISKSPKIRRWSCCLLPVRPERRAFQGFPFGESPMFSNRLSNAARSTVEHAARACQRLSRQRVVEEHFVSEKSGKSLPFTFCGRTNRMTQRLSDRHLENTVQRLQSKDSGPENTIQRLHSRDSGPDTQIQRLKPRDSSSRDSNPKTPKHMLERVRQKSLFISLQKKQKKNQHFQFCLLNQNRISKFQKREIASISENLDRGSGGPKAQKDRLLGSTVLIRLGDWLNG